MAFKFLFKPQSSRARAASVGDDLIYAIGDIHGRQDLLDQLITEIVADVETLNGSARPIFVFLGDYIDRGGASSGVINRIIQLSDVGEVCALKGNHEDALLEFLNDASFGRTWAHHGGGATLASYGVDIPADDNEETWELTRQALLLAIPEDHLVFLKGLRPYVVFGDYLFVHAGVRPNIDLDQQSSEDLMWIRKEFIESEQPSKYTVVHGHTPTDEPFCGPWRIGVDTGAYITGVLTAVRLVKNNRKFINTAPRSPRAEPGNGKTSPH